MQVELCSEAVSASVDICRDLGLRYETVGELIAERVQQIVDIGPLGMLGEIPGLPCRVRGIVKVLAFVMQ